MTLWIQTYSGKKFTIPDIDPETITVEDIAHALSNQCRFAGHCNSFYSVAEHSIYVSNKVPPEHALEGLFHDAAEAYLGDLTAPVKAMFPEFKRIEQNVLRAIFERIGLKFPPPPIIKEIDTRMLLTEKHELMQDAPEAWFCDELESFDQHIYCWEPKEAEKMFLRVAKNLIPHRYFQNVLYRGRGS